LKFKGVDMNLVIKKMINIIKACLVMSILIFQPNHAQASIFSRFMSEALEGAFHVSPKIAARELRKEIDKSDNNVDKTESNLIENLKKIDEKNGKMANAITNTIFVCNTPEQKIIPKLECDRIKNEFKKRVKGEQLSQVKLVFMVNFKCTDYSIVVLDALHESISSGKSAKEFEYSLNELKKCSTYLNLVSGYDKNSANSYSVFSEKFAPIINDSVSLGKDSKGRMAGLIGSVIYTTKITQEQVRKAAEDWF
jgi:hypothetical protein